MHAVLLFLLLQHAALTFASSQASLALSAQETRSRVTRDVPSDDILADTAPQATTATTAAPTAFAAPAAFPTSLFSRYYNDPTQTTEQVQPIISDPVLHTVYPHELTNPDTIPSNNTADPHPLPQPASPSLLLSQLLSQITTLASPQTFNSPFNTSTPNGACAACQAALIAIKALSLALPNPGGVDGTLALCNAFQLLGPGSAGVTACDTQFGEHDMGALIVQVVASANVAGYDGQAICFNFLGLCPAPPTPSLNNSVEDLTRSGWFKSPKPNPLPKPKQPSGKRLKVLHLSDFHIDPRYKTGAEANCTAGFCCRNGLINEDSPHQTLLPAPQFGAYLCDTSFSLAAASLQSIPVLAGVDPEKGGFDFTIYTGDLVSHDPDNQLSRAYTLYTETVVYDLFKKTLGGGPVYPALGNHDSYNSAQDAPHSLGGNLGEQFSWNYDHVAGLWGPSSSGGFDWIPESSSNDAKAHYGAYSVSRSDGLRVMTLNTDFWYRANLFNYINMSFDADPSGMLRFLTEELEEAEEAGDRVWILGHVLSGWAGSDALEGPSDLFYQIVDRFSPHVIANIFWGHSHQDHFQLYYANNGTTMNASTAQAVSWIGPSITPLTNLNSGFRVYEVDSSTFEILDSFTWISDVSSFPDLPKGRNAEGPTYELEYSARELYGPFVDGFGPDDPLNATWWHLVTEAMEQNPSLVDTFNLLQGKHATLFTTNCTSDECVGAKVCYMRSGSSPLSHRCATGFGSVV